MIPPPALAALLCGVALAATPQIPAAGFDPSVEKDFDKRVEDYMKLRKTAHEGLDKLKPTGSAEKIEHHEGGLAHQIRQLRPNAKPGDIFNPDAAAQFRSLIGAAMQGDDAARVRKSLRRAEPVHLKPLRVNRSYPKGVPLQSTPPTLLLSLPKLPAGLEYRVVGRALVLLDAEAGLIVDFIPDALPAGTDAR